MNAGLLLFVVSALGLFAAAVVQHRRRRGEAKLAALRAAARLLGGEHDDHRAWGDALGPRATLALVTRNETGRSRRDWTEVTAALPGDSLELRVKSKGLLGGLGASGEVHEGTALGDEAFDREFALEAAPMDVVRRLLDAPTRAQLSHFFAVELTTERTTQRVLRMALPGWLLDEGDARRALQLVAGIAGRVKQAYDQAEDAVPVPLVGPPFRAAPDDRAAVAAAEAREAEVERLRAHRRQRAELLRAVAIGAVLVLATLVAAFALG
ncbi:MAG: hypothetical protein IPI49_09240 [Myxococcales bacterium]|nr:hypothetical protein [Myxococcales bacterium]